MCYSGKENSPCHQHPETSPNVFLPTSIISHGFGSKDLSDPKDEKTQNHAMVNVNPLDCPKPMVLPNKI